ncbi:hypothetical protein HNY73_005794 [Argiope bruennichi]|uniref:Uncharacterized protein n=1 Tax=Argiope bruennichi TaxID=94029 RepID=A0A8T0FHV5_ARGBR|nr:hypothetical protein HNY73_005794 [Argiope bruennichi]
MNYSSLSTLHSSKFYFLFNYNKKTNVDISRHNVSPSCDHNENSLLPRNYGLSELVVAWVTRATIGEIAKGSLSRE